MKLTKEMSGLYTYESQYNGQGVKIEFSQSCGSRGWNWSCYVDGLYHSSDGGSGFSLKDFRHSLKTYGLSYFVD